jgi:hypothetical protein
LVRPDDRHSVDEIFRVNTCLWGGKYNPIIPSFRRIPRWWERDNHHFETASQVIHGYLDFFEPDFLVESEPGLAQGLKYDNKRVIQLSEVLPMAGDRDRKAYGLTVIDLYHHLYDAEFKFATRHKPDILDVEATNATFSSLASCLFGAFPKEESFRYFADAFNDIFEPRLISLDAASLIEIYRGRATSALRLGHSKLDVQYHDDREQILYIFDPSKVPDLIDYWNLRAIHRRIVPFPVQWIKELSELCKDIILKSHGPLAGNSHGVMTRATVMFGRSIKAKSIKGIYENYIRVDQVDANLRQDWYPPIWRPSPMYTLRRMRPTLSNQEKTFDVPTSNDEQRVRFDTLYPDFAAEYGSRVRWANVVRLRDWTFKDKLATIFPCTQERSDFPRLRLGGDRALSTTEGLVIFPRFKNHAEVWELTDGTSAINLWLKTNGVEATLSDAGRTTQQIIQTLDGFRGVESFAHPDIVKLLDEISRRPISRSVQYQEFENRINDATKGDIWRTHNFRTLVEGKAVELGLELRCTKCSSWSWYSLRQLDYHLTCQLCLRQFGFPIVNPSSSKSSKWAYRLIGPFALPDYAKGGYAASLSIRFFSEIIGDSMRGNLTWSAGQELEIDAKTKIEADYILWYQRREIIGNDYPTDVLFGEAKSFGKDAFKSEDVLKMRSLATRFPGSVFVFSTMKQANDLSSDEIERIAKFALWGREPIVERGSSRAPVILLTGAELFAGYSLHTVWQNAGGKHAEFAEHSLGFENLRVLADMTQQLYLRLPSYSSWLRDKWSKKAVRR